jgi:hypothetical protein
MIQDKSNSPILVTGVQRSGSSIVARIIAMQGVFAGQVSKMQENVPIKNMLVTPYYEAIHMPKSGQYPLPDTNKILIPVDWAERVKKVLSQQFYVGVRPWMFKSYTNCQIWPIWNYAYPNAKWIIVRRRPPDVIHSCMETAYMEAFKNKEIQKLVGAQNEREGWLWWIHEHEKRFVEMIEAGLNCKVIWPERMVNGDYSQIIEMLQWLGLEWDDSLIKVIDPLLWNSSQKERSK